MSQWQAMLDRHREVFTEMDRRAHRHRLARGLGHPARQAPRRRAARAEVDMLAWEVENGGMQAAHRTLCRHGHGPASTSCWWPIAEAHGGGMRADLAGDMLTTIKRLIRRGNIMFFVFKNKAQLQDAGYEDFLESLGLAFLGACR
jgi:hypothetical protein